MPALRVTGAAAVRPARAMAQRPALDMMAAKKKSVKDLSPAELKGKKVPPSPTPPPLVSLRSPPPPPHSLVHAPSSSASATSPTALHLSARERSEAPLWCLFPLPSFETSPLGTEASPHVSLGGEPAGDPGGVCGAVLPHGSLMVDGLCGAHMQVLIRGGTAEESGGT